MNNLAIKMEHVTKEYRLGAIGSGTLRGDLQSLFARLRHREDPNTKIGETAGKSQNEKFLALNDISLEVEKGEILGIIGHNGAGKSTLLKLLSRVTAPTRGTIGINGRVASMLEVGTGFHPELTGRENIYINGAILGMSRAEITRKYDEIVEFAELEKFIDTPIKRYSSGMYVKLAFAVAAHLDNEILVMDEVLAVGDMKFQDKCLGKMGDVSKEDGRTVLYVSHNMSTIKRLCKQCMVLGNGQILYRGDVDHAIDIYSNNLFRLDTVHEFKRADYWDYYARTIQMLTCELTNTKDCVYHYGDTIRARLHCHSDMDTDEIRLRAEFYNGTDMMTGIACSAMVGSFRKGQDKVIEFQTGTSMLSAGNYRVTLVLYSSNALGMSTTVDLGKNAMTFQIYDEPCAERIIGNPRLGGFTRYADLELCV